jgi:hypothetical protein
MGQGDTDAIDCNGNITVNGGTIDITAQMSSFDYDGTATYNGGTIIINGEEVNSIPQSMMGGGGMGGRGGMGGQMGGQAPDAQNGNGFGGNGGYAPWMFGQMNTNNDVQRGFDQNAVMTGITGLNNAVNAGFTGVQTQLCNGFAGVQNGFAQAEISANGRQMADMNQMFGLQSALQNCCCENRAATADLKYTMATEAAATRANCDNNNQKILDKLCQLELDGVKQNYEGQLRAMQTKLDAANLENQTLKFDASQIRQNSLIQQGLTSEVDALYNRLNNCPVQTIPVYGRQPIFTCGGQGCGCGYNGFAA